MDLWSKQQHQNLPLSYSTASGPQGEPELQYQQQQQHTAHQQIASEPKEGDKLASRPSNQDSHHRTGASQSLEQLLNESPGKDEATWQPALHPLQEQALQHQKLQQDQASYIRDLEQLQEDQVHQVMLQLQQQQQQQQHSQQQQQQQNQQQRPQQQQQHRQQQLPSQQQNASEQVPISEEKILYLNQIQHLQQQPQQGLQGDSSASLLPSNQPPADTSHTLCIPDWPQFHMYMAGLIDSEVKLLHHVYRKEGESTIIDIVPEFLLPLPAAQLDVVRQLQAFLGGVGELEERDYNGQAICVYRVRAVEELMGSVMPYLQALSPVLMIKQREVAAFQFTCSLLLHKATLSQKSFTRIETIRQFLKMSRGLSTSQISASAAALLYGENPSQDLDLTPPLLAIPQGSLTQPGMQQLAHQQMHQQAEAAQQFDGAEHLCFLQVVDQLMQDIPKPSHVSVPDEYLVALMECRGFFEIKVSGSWLSPFLLLCMKERFVSLLHCFQEALEVGNVKQDKHVKSKHYRYRLDNPTEIRERVIPFFDRYRQLLRIKGPEYDVFRSFVLMLEEHEGGKKLEWTQVAKVGEMLDSLPAKRLRSRVKI